MDRMPMVSWLLCLLIFLCQPISAFAEPNNEYLTAEPLTVKSYTLSDLATARLSAYGFLPEKYLVPQDQTDLPISREDAVLLLYRAFGTIPSHECPFSDVAASYREAVAWAYENGLTHGTTKNTFGSGNITRNNFLIMLQRLVNEPVLPALSIGTGNFTMGDAAFLIEEILSHENIENNIPEKINQIPFPEVVEITPASEEEMDIMLKKAIQYLPEQIVVKRAVDFSERAFLKEFYHYRSIQYGLEENGMLEDSWIYSYLYGKNAVSVKYREKECDTAQEILFEQSSEIQNLIRQLFSDEISSEEYEYRLDITRAQQFGSNSEMSLYFTYNQAWQLICDGDKAFSYYQNTNLSDKAEQFYESQSKKMTGKTNSEKVITVKQIIMDHASYGDADDPSAHELLEFFDSGLIVCDAYAQIFQFFMLKENIPCVTVSGSTVEENGSIDHDWSKVQLNGKWYNMDVCWADTGFPSQYDLKSDAYYSTHHHWPVNYQYGAMAATESM